MPECNLCDRYFVDNNALRMVRSASRLSQYLTLNYSRSTTSRSTRLNATTVTVRSGLQREEINMRERNIASVAPFATENLAPEIPWINIRRPSILDTNADTATRNLHLMQPVSSIRMRSMHLDHLHLRIYSHSHTSKLRSLLPWRSLM